MSSIHISLVCPSSKKIFQPCHIQFSVLFVFCLLTYLPCTVPADFAALEVLWQYALQLQNKVCDDSSEAPFLWSSCHHSRSPLSHVSVLLTTGFFSSLFFQMSLIQYCNLTFLCQHLPIFILIISMKSHNEGFYFEKIGEDDSSLILFKKMKYILFESICLNSSHSFVCNEFLQMHTVFFSTFFSFFFSFHFGRWNFM